MKNPTNTTKISLKLLLTINLRGCLCHLATENKTALNLLLRVLTFDRPRVSDNGWSLTIAITSHICVVKRLFCSKTHIFVITPCSSHNIFLTHLSHLMLGLCGFLRLNIILCKWKYYWHCRKVHLRVLTVFDSLVGKILYYHPPVHEDFSTGRIKYYIVFMWKYSWHYRKVFLYVLNSFLTV